MYMVKYIVVISHDRLLKCLDKRNYILKGMCIYSFLLTPV